MDHDLSVRREKHLRHLRRQIDQIPATGLAENMVLRSICLRQNGKCYGDVPSVYLVCLTGMCYTRY